jgi:hypothetical protein
MVDPRKVEVELEAHEVFRPIELRAGSLFGEEPSILHPGDARRGPTTAVPSSEDHPLVHAPEGIGDPREGLSSADRRGSPG